MSDSETIKTPPAEVTQPISDTAMTLIIKIAVIVFMAEAIVMFALAAIGPLPTLTKALLDSTLLSLLLAPVFFFLLYRPLAHHINELRLAEASLSESLLEQKRINSELKRAHEQIIESEKLASLGLLTAGIAHEIRGPITYIDANLKAFNDYTRDIFRLIATYEDTHAILGHDHALMNQLDELREEIDITYLINDTPELIDQSIQGVGRVKNIIQNYKEFSRQSTDEWELADIHQGIESTLVVVWNELKYTTEVVKEYGDLPEIECILPQLNQVFMNLLVNGAHAIGKKGTITIRTSTDDTHVCIAISDSGCGMTEEQKARIFEPFYTTKPRGKGTGLGLAISLGIIEKHNGTVDVNSTPGEGTEFQITLPIKQPEEATSE